MFSYLKLNSVVRYLLRRLTDKAGSIWEGFLEEVTCVLAMGGIPRAIWREKQLDAGGGRKSTVSGLWGTPAIFPLDSPGGENDAAVESRSL